MPGVPQQIDQYPVQRLLGKGGMASVYLVVDPRTQNLLALKVISDDLDEELDRLRFEREFRLATRFNHPNLVRVYEMGYWQNRPYYTMELVQGPNIREYLQEKSLHLSWEDWGMCFGAIGAQLLAGLEYIHSQQVIHRDLKPENIFVDAHGQVKFLDFGLARDTLSDTKFTQTGMVLGTPAYMAPEQFGAGQLDARSDLYAMGVIFYELLSGRLPHPGQDMRSVIFHLLTQPPEPLLCFGSIPTPLESLIQRLLAREPADRYPSCQDVLSQWLGLFPHLSVTRSSGPRELYQPAYYGQDHLMMAASSLLEKRRGIMAARSPGGGGKSRWLEEVGRLGLQSYWHVAHARCGAWKGIPYGPWIEILRGAFETGFPADLEAQRSTLAVLLPELGTPTPLGEAGKLRLFRCIGQALSRRNPGLLVLLDDIHEMDQVSLEMLTFLMRGEAPGLVMIGTVASEFDPGTLPFPIHELEGLSPEESRRVAESVLGQKLAEPSADALWQASRGNPMMLLELIKEAFVGGDFVQRDGRFQLEENCVLPQTLREALERRMGALTPRQKDLLYWLAAWRGLAEFDSITTFFENQPALELVDDLETLVRLQLVVRENKGYYLLPQIGEVITAGLGASQRCKWHEQIARKLQTLPTPPQERIGMHWLAAQRPDLARQPLLLAAELQAGLFNFSRALELYECIQELPGELEDGVREKMADAFLGDQRIHEALQIYLDLEKRAPQNRELQVKIARCHWRQGNLKESHRVLGEEALPSSSFWSKFSLGVDWARLVMGAPLARTAASNSEKHVRNLLRRTLLWLRPPGWQMDSLALTLKEMATDKNSPEGKIRQSLLQGVGLILGPTPLLQRARAPLMKAAQMAMDLPGAGGELLGEIAYYALLAGCPQGMELLLAGWTRAEFQGDLRPMMDCAALLTQFHRLAGRLNQAQRWANELLQVVQHAQDQVELARFRVQQSLIYSLTGEGDRAARQLEIVPPLEEIELLAWELRLARCTLKLFQGDRAGCLAESQDPGMPVGKDLFRCLEFQLLRVYAGEKSLDAVLKHAQDTYPCFKAAALRLSGKPEQSLQIARSWDFPLEQGLALLAQARKNPRPELLTASQGALERAGLSTALIESILRKPGSYALAP